MIKINPTCVNRIFTKLTFNILLGCKYTEQKAKKQSSNRIKSQVQMWTNQIF